MRGFGKPPQFTAMREVDLKHSVARHHITLSEKSVGDGLRPDVGNAIDVVDDLERLPAGSWMVSRYDDLVRDPNAGTSSSCQPHLQPQMNEIRLSSSNHLLKFNIRRSLND